MSLPFVRPGGYSVVLAVDPGTAKCGLAVVERDGGGMRPLHREIVPTERAAARAAELQAEHGASPVLVGDATGGKRLAQALRDALPPGVSVEMVGEARTSERARARYDRENPPRGWLLRLLPSGLRTPPVPYDDYAAVILAEDYLAGRSRND